MGELLNSMAEIFKGVSTKNNVPMGDFPNPHKFASIMKNFEMWKFPALKPQEIRAIDEVLGRGVPKLLEQVEEKKNQQNEQENNPFFNGAGGQIKQIMMQSQLSNNVLGKIWQLADIDRDGVMGDQEFALCCYLLEYAKDGKAIPTSLPDNFVPPQFREMVMKKK